MALFSALYGPVATASVAKARKPPMAPTLAPPTADPFLPRAAWPWLTPTLPVQGIGHYSAVGASESTTSPVLRQQALAKLTLTKPAMLNIRPGATIPTSTQPMPGGKEAKPTVPDIPMATPPTEPEPAPGMLSGKVPMLLGAAAVAYFVFGKKLGIRK